MGRREIEVYEIIERHPRVDEAVLCHNRQEVLSLNDSNSKHVHTHNHKYANEVTLDLKGNMSDIKNSLRIVFCLIENGH